MASSPEAKERLREKRLRLRKVVGIGIGLDHSSNSSSDDNDRASCDDDGEGCGGGTATLAAAAAEGEEEDEEDDIIEDEDSRIQQEKERKEKTEALGKRVRLAVGLNEKNNGFIDTLHLVVRRLRQMRMWGRQDTPAAIAECIMTRAKREHNTKRMKVNSSFVVDAAADDESDSAGTQQCPCCWRRAQEPSDLFIDWSYILNDIRNARALAELNCQDRSDLLTFAHILTSMAKSDHSVMLEALCVSREQRRLARGAAAAAAINDDPDRAESSNSNCSHTDEEEEEEEEDAMRKKKKKNKKTMEQQQQRRRHWPDQIELDAACKYMLVDYLLNLC